MKKLLIFIEVIGKQNYVGDILYNSNQDAEFMYAEEYLSSNNAAPISISLPLQKEPFSTLQTRSFFEGLLPEGFTRRTVAHWMHVDEEDYLSLLSGLGNECLGAIKVVEENAESIPARYEKLEINQIGELAAEGATKSAELITKSHLSLTGASGKTGLYYDDITKNWFVPYGEAPSTHIVKQSHVRLKGIVTNEQLCLLTASKLGLSIPESFIVNTGNASDGEILFATRRYDRKFTEKGKVIDGLKVPFRLHQEDFAQAMGITSSHKYEKSNEGYLNKMFQVLFEYAENPIREQMKLWNIIIFDFLVGNTDNHIKNLSILYSDNLKGIELAPAYDIVSTTVYESSTRDMGISIGNKISIDEITIESFKEESQKNRMNEKTAINCFLTMASNFEAALKDASAELKEQGFYSVDKIYDKILLSGGYAKL